jgi:hypothetical protein
MILERRIACITMVSAVLERQKGVSKDLTGGGLTKWRIRKAAVKRTADSFRIFSEGAGVALLGGIADAEQCHSNEVGDIAVCVGLCKSSRDFTFPGTLLVSHLTPSTH